MDVADFILGLYGAVVTAFLLRLQLKKHKESKARLAFNIDCHRLAEEQSEYGHTYIEEGEINSIVIEATNVGPRPYFLRCHSVQQKKPNIFSLKPLRGKTKTQTVDITVEPGKTTGFRVGWGVSKWGYGFDIPLDTLKSSTWTDVEGKKCKVPKAKIKEAIEKYRASKIA